MKEKGVIRVTQPRLLQGKKRTCPSEKQRYWWGTQYQKNIYY